MYTWQRQLMINWYCGFYLVNVTQCGKCFIEQLNAVFTTIIVTWGQALVVERNVMKKKTC